MSPQKTSSKGFSGQLIGAGIIAGGEFYCAGAARVKPLSLAAVTSCMQPLGRAPKAELAYQYARAFAAQGDIDDTENLKHQRIYLFSGAKDSVVFTKVVDQAERFFKLAGVPSRNIGTAAQVEEGRLMNSAVLSDINTELSRLGVASADIVMTGGGGGTAAVPYRFELANIVMG